MKSLTLYEHLKEERDWLRQRLNVVHNLITAIERDAQARATTITPAPMVQGRTVSGATNSGE